MHVGEIELILFPEWYSRIVRTQNCPWDPPHILLFGSFLDNNSLELLLFFNDLTNHTLNSENITAFNQEFWNTKIQAIFFPISTKTSINYIVWQKFLNLLNKWNKYQQESSPCEHENMLQLIQEFTHFTGKIVNKNYERIAIKTLITQNFSNPKKVSPNKKNKKNHTLIENQILFGKISACFLEKIQLFPKIILYDQIYNGIPYGMTVSTFLKKILIQEIHYKYLENNFANF